MHDVTGLISVLKEIFSLRKTKHADEMNFIYAQVKCDLKSDKNGLWIDALPLGPSELT